MDSSRWNIVFLTVMSELNTRSSQRYLRIAAVDCSHFTNCTVNVSHVYDTRISCLYISTLQDPIHSGELRL